MRGSMTSIGPAGPYAVFFAAAFFFFFLKNGMLGLAIIQMKANNKSAMKGYFLI